MVSCEDVMEVIKATPGLSSKEISLKLGMPDNIMGVNNISAKIRQLAKYNLIRMEYKENVNRTYGPAMLKSYRSAD